MPQERDPPEQTTFWITSPGFSAVYAGGTVPVNRQGLQGGVPQEQDPPQQTTFWVTSPGFPAVHVGGTVPVNYQGLQL